MLQWKYEALSFHDGESVDEFALRLTAMLNVLIILDNLE
jgi:hypothetical protein